MAPETIRLQNRDVPYETARIAVDQLRLDPANPRIQYLIGRIPGEITQARLDELLWAKEPIKALAMAIKQNGGVYSPLIVQRVDGEYHVREGNSRAVATRHLQATHPDDKRFMTVPAMIFDEQLTQEDLAVLLAEEHVSGKNRWDAYEQAKHVYDLYNSYGKTYEWLSTRLRLSKAKIAQDLKAYKWTSDYLDVNPDPKNVEKFAFFQELARKSHLAQRFQDELDFQQSFARWLSESRLTASAQVRKLDLVLSNPEAAKVLDEKGYEDAAKVLIREDPALGSDLYDAIKRATEQISKAPMDEVQGLGENPQKLIMLRNLRRAIDDLATLAKVQL
jgi:ParB-like nuclease domain